MSAGEDRPVPPISGSVSGPLQVAASGVVKEGFGGLAGRSVPIPWTRPTSTLGEPAFSQFHFDQEQTAEPGGCCEVKHDVHLSPVLPLLRVVSDDGPRTSKFGQVVAGSVVLKTDALNLDIPPQLRGNEGVEGLPSSFRERKTQIQGEGLGAVEGGNSRGEGGFACSRRKGPMLVSVI